jgi:hypothetical protein
MDITLNNKKRYNCQLFSGITPLFDIYILHTFELCAYYKGRRRVYIVKNNPYTPG